jgi:hypothetical protein
VVSPKSIVAKTEPSVGAACAQVSATSVRARLLIALRRVALLVGACILVAAIWVAPVIAGLYFSLDIQGSPRGLGGGAFTVEANELAQSARTRAPLDATELLAKHLAVGKSRADVFTFLETAGFTDVRVFATHRESNTPIISGQLEYFPGATKFAMVDQEILAELALAISTSSEESAVFVVIGLSKGQVIDFAATIQTNSLRP